MKISIITVVYNNVKAIKNAIDSVLSQSYPNIEYIIVDGNSTDGTKELVASYGNKITTFISESDYGIYDAMNKGLRFATGDYVAFLNADDVYASSTSVASMAHLLQQTQADVGYANLIYLHPEPNNTIKRYWKSGNFSKLNFLLGFTFPHPTFFAKKSLFDKYGGFNTSLKIAADYELTLRFTYKNESKVVYLPEILVKMRAGGASNGNIRNRFRANSEDRQAWVLNHLNPYFFTFLFKPLRKLPQYIFKSIPK